MVEMAASTVPMSTRIVDARGSYCPGPLMELIRVIRESQPGQVIAVYSSDSGSRTDIPKWVDKAGHRLIDVTARDGFDEILVEKWYPDLQAGGHRRPVHLFEKHVGQLDHQIDERHLIADVVLVEGPLHLAIAGERI